MSPARFLQTRPMPVKMKQTRMEESHLDYLTQCWIRNRLCFSFTTMNIHQLKKLSYRAVAVAEEDEAMHVLSSSILSQSMM